MLVRKCFGCQLCPLQAIFMGSGMPAVNAISGGWLVYVRAPGAVLGADVGGGGVGGGGGPARAGAGGGAAPWGGASARGPPRGGPAAPQVGKEPPAAPTVREPEPGHGPHRFTGRAAVRGPHAWSARIRRPAR